VDAAEFDAFYLGTAPRITRQVHAMIGDREEACDCVQEAFARAWAQRRTFAHVRNPDAWIRTTAYRLAVSRWRRTVLERRSPDRARQVVAPVGAPDETYVDVMAALREIPAHHRRAVVLHHLADLPVREVALELGVPENTVKSWLRRGRAALGVLLADAAPDELAEVGQGA
jgi:RNA polymerase sigma-70 factor, ECF subfamily